MYRCKGRSADGKRCKRKLTVLDGFCPTHNDRLGVPLEADTLSIEEKPVECFRDMAPSSRPCGHACDLTAEKCCVCSDTRPADTKNKTGSYCPVCKIRSPQPLREAPRNYVRYARRNRVREEEEVENDRVFRIFIKHYIDHPHEIND